MKTDMRLYWEIFRQSGRDFVRVFQQMASGNTLLRNNGDGTFRDVTQLASANPRGWFWGASSRCPDRYSPIRLLGKRPANQR